MHIIWQGFFDEENRADMKSGDTNKIIHILKEKKVYLWQKIA